VGLMWQENLDQVDDDTMGIPYSALLASVTARTLARDRGGPAQYACIFFLDEFARKLFSGSLAAAVSNSKMFQFETVHF
jgi:hypothetical protein